MRTKTLLEMLKPIESERQYQKALIYIEQLMDSKKGSPESNVLNVLSILIDTYEEKHFHVPLPDPIEAIKFRMEQLGVSNKEVALMIGGKSRVSEVLNKKRRLTVKMMQELHYTLGVPAESLLNG